MNGLIRLQGKLLKHRDYWVRKCTDKADDDTVYSKGYAKGALDAYQHALEELTDVLLFAEKEKSAELSDIKFMLDRTKRKEG